MNRIRQTLSHKQTQNLLLKPKMLQSLEMLAMPILELQTHLKQEMITNPMLELKELRDEDEEEQEQEDKKENSDQEERSGEDLDEESSEYEKTLEETKELSEILDAYNDFHGENYSRAQRTDEKANFEQIIRAAEDHAIEFISQLEKLGLDEKELEFANELIDSTNDYGFLPTQFSVANLSVEFGIEEFRGEEIRGMILKLEPRGITALNIEECLIAQLDDSEENVPVIQLIKENFDDLIHKRYKKIANKFGVCISTVLLWRDRIAHLDPKPGLRLLGSEKDYIVPDVILKKIGNEYEIIVNDFYFPSIRMSRRYRNILKLVKKDKNAVDYVRSKINSAKFLIKSIYLRSRTLERVTKAIIRNQYDFFYKNTGVLKPLTYSVIADEIQVNESTISRVVRSKYIDTPFGIMCLKDFFSSRAGKDDNYNSVSRQNVETRIIKMIELEDKHQPLSDQDIADKLREEGINVSRRVVAKYRKAKGILNSHLRKAII